MQFQLDEFWTIGKGESVREGENEVGEKCWWEYNGLARYFIRFIHLNSMQIG